MHSRNNKLQKLNLWIISNNSFKIVENSQCMLGNFVDRHLQQHFFLISNIYNSFKALMM